MRPSLPPSSGSDAIEVDVDALSDGKDVFTRIAIDAASWPAHLILGWVTVLDGARLRHRLVKVLNVDTRVCSRLRDQ